jgi:hypothetical protein
LDRCIALHLVLYSLCVTIIWSKYKIKLIIISSSLIQQSLRFNFLLSLKFHFFVIRCCFWHPLLHIGTLWHTHLLAKKNHTKDTRLILSILRAVFCNPPAYSCNLSTDRVILSSHTMPSESLCIMALTLSLCFFKSGNH